MAIRVTGKAQGNVDPLDLVQEGERRIADDLSSAEGLFLQASHFDRNLPQAYNGLGVVAFKRQNFKEAEKHFKEAVRLRGNYAEAWNNLGAVYIKRGKYSEAKLALEKALSLNPDLKDARDNLWWLVENIFGFHNESLPTVSLCMIVKNEEENLPRALSSVASLVDEIIVVDTGSTDRTREIARSFGARVYDFAWRDDFAAARNESLRHATGEWILVLDADDEVEKEGFQKLRLFLKYTDCWGLMLPIRSPLDELGHNVMTNYLTRIFRNHPEVRFRRRIHEEVETSLVLLGKKVGRFDEVSIRHHGYRKGTEVNKKVQERNYRILLQELRENPSDVGVLSYLGRTHFLRGEMKIAKAILEKTLRKSSSFNFAVLSACLDLGWIYHLEGDSGRALEYFNYVKEREPNLPDVYYLIGKVYQEKGDYLQALQSFEKVLTVDARLCGSLMVFFKVDMEDLYLRLTECASLVGDRAKAKEYSKKLEQYSSAGLFNNLGVAMIDKGLWDEAEEYFRKALSLDPRQPQARGNLLQLLFERGKVKEAQECLREMEKVLVKS
ncbi:MAG: tetratricopeptide repeat protein [Candidatus Atribacteria bacterium]|nr:tetratricopeptide repeat protein [Candidatus Atribacteria bacterium]